MKNKESIDNSLIKNKVVVVIFSLIPIILGCFLFKIFICFIPFESYNHTVLGQLGDFFGGILNPVVAYLGLVAIVFTLDHNRHVLYYEFVSLRETQNAHIRAIGQSAAIAVFNAFEDEVQRVRSRSNNEAAYKFKINILKGINMLDKPEYKGYVTQMIMEWGAVARIFSLIIKITKSTFLDADIVAAAIAVMDKDECDYVMMCLAKLSPDSLRYMIDNEDISVSEDMALALQKIANV